MILKDIVKKASRLLFEDTGGTINPNADAGTSGIPEDLLKQLSSTSSVTLEQLNKQMPGASASDIRLGVTQESISPVASTPKPPATPIISGDTADFTPIYEEANLPKVPLTAEGFLKMLAELGDIPIPAKRTMVGTMLNTMSKSTPGVNSASIANDALLKIKSLAVYSDGIKNQLKKFVAEREKSIADSEERIKQEKKAIETINTRVEKLVKWSEQEGNLLDDVLEFFSADTGDSKLTEVQIPVGL